MQIDIKDPTYQTIIFGAVFITVLFLSLRKRKDSLFSPTATQELKGLSILGIVFSHIGYVLSRDNTFLWPFSIIAGVGVNLFLFLSGYGLTISALKKPLTIFEFYKKRLLKLFIPLWIILTLYLLMDLFILGRTYPTNEIIRSFLGYFPRADVAININSPLWYFSLILFYYLLFPFATFKKLIYISPLIFLTAFNYIIDYPIKYDPDTLKLLELHSYAFPLGVALAIILNNTEELFFTPLINYLRKNHYYIKNLIPFLRFLIVLFLFYVFAYTSINSNVGGGVKIEQITSLITMFCLLLIFILKRYEFKLLTIFGVFSYEIYLIHWPLLYRYDIFYKYLPASLATLLYLALFIGLSYLLQKLISTIEKPLKL